VTDNELRTSVEGPNPYGVRDLRFEWIIPAAGRFGGDQSVTRSEATHARMKSSAGHETITKAEAEERIATSIEYALKHEQALIEADTMDSFCARCDNASRSHGETLQLQFGSAFAERFVGALAVSNFAVTYYVCKTCGSLEFFDNAVLSRYKRERSTSATKEQ
jgi:hypothetical protein